MESKDIVFTGLGRAVSDLDIPDGELSVSHNIIRDNGSMKPIWIPGDMITLESGENLVYVHRTSEYRNYIVNTNGTLYFFTDDNPSRTYIASVSSGMKDIIAVGNTLVVASDEGLQYLLYKDGSYKYLGTKPPELDISFRLNISKLDSEAIKISADGNTGTDTFDAEVQQSVSTQIASAVNGLLKEAEDNNYFTSTFYVRWAYRLYNGVYMSSPPVMMPLNGGVAPVLSVRDADQNIIDPSEGVTEFYLRIGGYKGRLEYEIPFFYSDKQNELDEWKDIITGVEIYATKGVISFNQDGRAEKIATGGYGAHCVSYGYMPSSSGVSVYARRGYYPYNDKVIEGMHKPDSEYIEQLKSESVFYRLKSYKIEELGSGGEVELADGALSRLTTSSKLSSETDSYQDHDILIPEGMSVYNGRINLYGVKSRKYNFPLYSMSAFTNGYLSALNSRASTDDEEAPDTEGGSGDSGDDGETPSYMMSYEYNVRFLVKSEGKSINVTRIYGIYKMYEPPLYLFYPDNNATGAIIERYNSSTGYYEQAEVVLSSHPYLQGSYWFDGFEPLVFTQISSSDRLSEDGEDRIVTNSNKIFTSEVNNPFIFPLAGINTVGLGEIKGIASVTKALSQGQFGQFPLYVFSTDGVWAMEVAANGLYSSIKPISRDVCINGDSITQTDNAVLFVSEKGVMMIDGSEISCISDMMNGRSFDITTVSMLPDVMANESIPSDFRGIHDFMDYARVGRMAYDYPNGRVILYAEGMDYVYVFSLTSLTWATLGASIDNAVNDYPDTYVQTGTGVKNLSTRIDYDNASLVKTLLVTRPLKLGDDGYKTVYEMVSRGAMDRKKGALLLWGSYDGIDYTLIADAIGNRIYRTGGTAYRYYRIGVVGEMPVGESLSMVSMLFRRKYGNKLR